MLTLIATWRNETVLLKRKPIKSPKTQPRTQPSLWMAKYNFKHHILPPIELSSFTLMLEIYNRTEKHVVSHLHYNFRVRFYCVSSMNECDVTFFFILFCYTPNALIQRYTRCPHRFNIMSFLNSRLEVDLLTFWYFYLEF